MRSPSPQWLAYSSLRDEVVAALPPGLPVFRVKEAFQSLVPSRRRYARIHSVADLILELEHQLVIFPECRGVSALSSVLHCSQQAGAKLDQGLLDRVDVLVRDLEPAVPSPRAKEAANLPPGRVPARLVVKLARDLERAGGRDWEHLATGLGRGLGEQEVVRVRQGEVDTIEREFVGNVGKILKVVVQRFEDRCLTAGVQGDLVEHIASLLESEEVFEPPLRRMARELREERGRGGEA